MPLSYRPDPFDRRTRRQYAVALLVPEELDEVIAPIRERYDTDHNVITSHVTIVFPFETNRSLESLSNILREATQHLPAIYVELGSIGDFYPDHPIIYWSVKASPSLTELYFNLHARLELPLPHKKYVPHITLAREISTHRVMLVKEKIVPYLPEEQFRAKAVDLVAPVADCTWVSVRTFPLISP